MTKPEDILPTYDAVGPHWARVERDTSLFERAHLERMLDAAPGRGVLDLGCGSGRPVAHWLAGTGARVTGVDGAASMIALFRRSVPDARAVHADMRGLALGERFDAILAFDSFFHLCPDDQRAMFATFAAHAAPGAALMFTAGPAASVRVGQVAGRRVYHASLDPEEYRHLMRAAGFRPVSYHPEDPACRGRTVWHAVFDA